MQLTEKGPWLWEAAPLLNQEKVSCRWEVTQHQDNFPFLEQLDVSLLKPHNTSPFYVMKKLHSSGAQRTISEYETLHCFSIEKEVGSFFFF